MTSIRESERVPYIPQKTRKKPPKTSQAQLRMMAKDRMRAFVYQHCDAILNALLDKAKEGDAAAAKELLNRAFGKAEQSVEVQHVLKPTPILANVEQIALQSGEE